MATNYYSEIEARKASNRYSKTFIALGIVIMIVGLYMLAVGTIWINIFGAGIILSGLFTAVIAFAQIK